MIISHKYQFIFIKTTKTAGTSIETYLSQYCGKEDIFTPFGREEHKHEPRNYLDYFNPLYEIVLTRGKQYKATTRDWLRKEKFFNHIPAYLVRCRISGEIWKSYFKFCVERNPWDKALSHYHFLRGRMGLKLSLDEYLEKNMHCLNYPKYMDYYNHDQIIVDRILKYEKLDEELGNVFRFLGVPFEETLGIYAKSNYRLDKRSYYEVLAPHQIDIIRTVYEKEIRMHGYKF